MPLGDLPTVSALDRLWREVAARPRWRRDTAWRWLKLRWSMRLALLDPARVRILAPPGKVNDCACCTELCCIGPRATVLLRLRDIATLIDIGRAELITQNKPTFAAADLAARPALRRHVSSAAWRQLPVLAHSPIGACAALSDAGRCTLYPHWPLSCARFPYALHADTREVFYSPRCDSYWIRADAAGRAREMAVAAVESYNERVKDAVLLTFARDELADLGLLDHVALGSATHPRSD
jgi:Fe-S-cluster containining protein